MACKDKTSKTIAVKPKAKITFSDNYIICDTCNTTVVVHHDDCTTCGEITVDSGAIYLTKEILKNVENLAINTDREDTFILPPNYIPLHELYLSDKHYFRTLWKDTIEYKDIYKAFRLTGKIVEIKRRVLDNGVVEIYPSLFFKVDKAVEVYSNYWKIVNGK